jgi:hypothetical protein
LQKLSKKNKPLAVLLVLLISAAFAFLSAEKGLFNRPQNMFEKLKVNPFEKGAVIEHQVEILYADADAETREKYDSLKNKAMHDQYYRFVTKILT